MLNRCSFCWVSVCLVGVLALLVPAGTARAQFNDGQLFTSPLAGFAVPPNLVTDWSLEAGCSAGSIVNGRGDGEDLNCLMTPTSPSTGTRLVRDLNQGSGSTTFGPICNSYLDDMHHVFLIADDGSGTTGPEFYRVLDSLYPVMTLKKDINPGPASPNLTGMTQQTPGGQGRIFFGADDGINGKELWVSSTNFDGATSEYMVTDINPGPGSSNPEGFGLTVTTTSKVVVFAADDGINGRELWACYTTGGTYPTPYSYSAALLKDINTTSAGASSNPQNITTVSYQWLYNSKAFFTADDGINGRELWRTDGTLAGTVMLKDIVAGSGSSNPTNLTAATILSDPSPSALFFTVGNDLWWSKGAIGGADTLKIKSIGATMSNLTVVSNFSRTSYTLYFVVGNALWKSDGTSAGTVSLKTFASTPTNLAAARNLLYLAADDGTGSGVELWKSDGTTAGTVLINDINPGAASSSPTNLAGSTNNSSLRFSADDGTNGRELWKSDGTAGSTALVKDINPGSTGSNPANMFLTGPLTTDILFFTANDGTHGRELWESDGYAEAGTSHTGLGYKWDISSLIQSKGDATKIAVGATDQNAFYVGATFDFPIMSPWGTLSPLAHQVNHYVEITDGTDRVPLDVSYVDCGDGNLLRPRAALTDGNNHNAIAFGMVSVLDQDPCDQDPRGAAYPGAPYANVPAIYDGHDWIPMDRAHIPAGVTTDPPVASTLGEAPRTKIYLHTIGTLPAGLVAAAGDPYALRRYTWIRLEVYTDYIRAYWYCKPLPIYVATIPRHYKGAFKALYIGNKGGLQTPAAFYFDTLKLNGGLFATSTDPYGACCTAAGCSDVVGNSSACLDGIYSAWKACGEPTTPVCCPIPWADSDRDGDVDMDDFSVMQRCLTPSSVTTACACFDKNADGAIDVTDVNKFATCAAGANVALTPTQITACDTLP